ncbi:MAG: hypothetical protein ACREA9_14385 [Pyrinomonadaceae bacterium]
MIENRTNYRFIQHSHQTLLNNIAFYLSVLLLINAETIIAALKHAARSHTLI